MIVIPETSGTIYDPTGTVEFKYKKGEPTELPDSVAKSLINAKKAVNIIIKAEEKVPVFGEFTPENLSVLSVANLKKLQLPNPIEGFDKLTKKQDFINVLLNAQSEVENSKVYTIEELNTLKEDELILLCQELELKDFEDLEKKDLIKLILEKQEV